jgi:hypothetical protein
MKKSFQTTDVHSNYEEINEKVRKLYTLKRRKLYEDVIMLIILIYYIIIHVRWVPVPTAWRVLRLKERPPAMEVSCEYIE